MNPVEEIAADAAAQGPTSPGKGVRDAAGIVSTAPAEETVLESDRPLGAAPAASRRPVLVEISDPGVRTVGQAPAVRRASRRAAAVGLVVLALAAGGWFGYQRLAVGPLSTIGPVSAAGPDRPASTTASDPAQPAAQEEMPGWKARMAEADRLRAALLAKAEEVRRLQQEYRFGVMEVEEELIHLIRRHGLESFQQAMRHRRVELGLRTVQSRQAYAAGLAKPLRWLAAGGEELLFVKRLLEFDLEVLPFAEGVDLEAHARRIDAVLHARRPAPERLAPAEGEPTPSLEAIWKRLADQARQLAVPATAGLDEAVGEEICSGDLARTAEMSVLRLKTARCLAESGAKELFLNRVSELPAAAAQKLSEWPGGWLCLNGLRRLSPEAARHLFAWPGRLISLNGLSELPADATAYLAGWSGGQLELMGLKKAEAVEHLLRFEQAGGKLFLPPEMRRQLDARRETPKPPVPAGKERR
ncbi:MAG: hypothetical protein R6V84_01505 [Desulfobacterales bacterium]